MTESQGTLTVLNHPLVQHKLSLLRDRNTPKKQFRELVDELTTLMAYEVTRDLPLEPVEIDTPLERMTSHRIRGKKLVVVPILRAGLGMVNGITRLIPSVRVGHVGFYRDEETLEPQRYYFKIPEKPEGRDFIVVDPMLATGGTAIATITELRNEGARSIRFMCLVAAPEGVQALSDAHPDVPVFTAALDRQLSDRGFILPGLGDAGDRLFGTR